MKNISSEVDYLGKSDVCCDGNSLFTLVTGVGNNNNFDDGKVNFSINLNVMATSELFEDNINENEALNVSNGLKEADAATVQNGVHHPNGVLSAKQQLLSYTCTWPGRPNNNHYNLLGKYRSVCSPKSDSENACANHNGHQTNNCADHEFTLGDRECLASRKIMVRSASMDNLESADVYALKSQQHVIKDICQVSGIETHSREDLSALNRRSSEPLNMIQPRPLNSVLENIPLAYNPKTKQLHLLKPNTNSVSNKNYQFQNPKSSDVESNNSCAQVVAGNNYYYYLNKCDAGSNQADNAQHHQLLQRVSTCGSLQSKTDYSSFSSISSLCTDVSVSTASAFDDNPNDGVFKSVDGDDASFTEINLNHSQHHRNRSSDGFLPEDPNSLEDQDSNGQGVKSKRRGLTGFLSRNLLAWRNSRDSNVGADETPGWKFFGKTPPRTQTQTDPNKIIEEYHERQYHSNCIDSTTGECSTPRSKRSDELVASSTTALILENRPSNLPSKAPAEEVKHRLEYQQMVEAAKKKEIKEAKLKKKLAQQQLRHEEQLSLAAKCWNAEILPNWETEKVCRKAKKLWWQGIPPSVRGKVWKLAIGNDLHITPELYEICVCRAKDRIKMAVESISVSEDDFEENLQDKESSVELIKLDVSRTFPQLCIFQKRGPCYDMLHSLLGAYVCYRPDVGYVQGMSFLAAVLILNLEVADAFICFANLMNKPCQLAFFRLDEQMMKTYFTSYEEYFCENLPKLFSHFSKQNLTPDLYLIDWIYTLYSRSLPLDVACRVWDVYFRDGDEFLFRTALGILRLYDDILLNMEFIHLAQFLTKLPEDIGADLLFKSIESIRMVIDKRSFAQVLQSYSEPKQT